MINRIINKIRALIEDLEKTDGLDSFTYSTSSKFTLSEANISSITQVAINDVVTTNYSFDSDTNEVTISDSLSSGDIIIIKYKYYNYSETELKSYISGALVHLSIYNKTFYYDTSEELLYPLPDWKDENLIALVAAIIIKPNYDAYRLGDERIDYPRNKTKEQKIKDAIFSFKSGKHGIFFTA